MTKDLLPIEPYFYGVSTRPPGIVEFDMQDIDNVKIRKLYIVEDKFDRFVGTHNIAVNENYIMALVINPDNLEQAIRVFSRNATLYSAPKFDIPVNPDTTLDYLRFPNHLLNLIIFRDERTVNITALIDYSLILNATNTTLVNKYKNLPVSMWLSAENSVSLLF